MKPTYFTGMRIIFGTSKQCVKSTLNDAAPRTSWQEIDRDASSNGNGIHFMKGFGIVTHIELSLKASNRSGVSLS